MDTIRLALYLTLFVAIAGLIYAIYYTIRQNNEHKARLRANPGTESVKSGGVAGGIFVIVFFLVIIILIGISVWSSTRRYQIASDAIRQGNTNVALAALAPEIGAGVGNVVQGIGGAIRGN